MAGFNHCVFVGRDGIDPQPRETNEGVSYCRFHLAVDQGKEKRARSSDGCTSLKAVLSRALSTPSTVRSAGINRVAYGFHCPVKPTAPPLRFGPIRVSGTVRHVRSYVCQQ